jgi:uncharacterized protein YecE (DUF72 family)
MEPFFEPLNRSGSDLTGKILVGVAGWSYPDWKGLVYPRESKFDRLEYMAHFFDTIEINTSFYAIPAPGIVSGWIQSVKANANFSFCVKLYKVFTHGSNVEHGQPELNLEAASQFKRAFEGMLESGKLGALLLQFPYRFHLEPKNLEHLARLFEHFRGFPLVLEVRHKSFAQPSFYQFLKREQVALACIDQPQVSYSMPATDCLTHSALAYLRFHGRNEKAWFASDSTTAERYNYDYSAAELEKYMEMTQEVQTSKGVLYVIFNNHYRAQQVKNALEFLHKITGQKVQVMPKLLNAYPELGGIALPV